MTTIVLSTLINASPNRCFDLARDVDVHTESTGSSGERVVGGVMEGAMALGDSVTFEARHFGRRWRMTSRITAFDPPHVFVDEQTAGPFRNWRHEHRFEPTDSGCRAVDLIRYAPPLGPLGSIVDTLFLRRYMTRLLRNRAAFLKRSAEAGT